MDSSGTVAEGLAIDGHRLVCVGTRDEIESLCDATTTIVELSGGTVLPGFIDTHMHLEKIAREMAMLQLDDARSIDDVLARVQGAAGRGRLDEWIRSFGDDNAWHERQLAECRLPSREELNAAGNGRPVFLYRGGAAALNDVAAERLAPMLEAVDDGGWDAGRGWLYGPTAKRVEAALPKASPERELEALESAATRLLASGVTTVVDPGLPAGFGTAWRLYERAQSSSLLPQRIYLMNRLDERRTLEEELQRVEDGPALPMEGDERLRAWSIKLLLDGEFANAWMREGERATGSPLRRWSMAELTEVVALCADRGWPLCVHAMGGAAIDAVIESIERACAAGARFSSGQVSIAHAFLASRENARACRELGIAISVQPLLGYVFTDVMLGAWGDLAQRANPFATLLSEGASVAGGSDTLPCEPLRGARYAADRRGRNGTVLGVDEALRPADALKLFTADAGPYIDRSDLGVLATGNVADFVVWDANPLETPLDQWLALKAELTAINGEVVWRA